MKYIKTYESSDERPYPMKQKPPYKEGDIVIYKWSLLVNKDKINIGTIKEITTDTASIEYLYPTRDNKKYTFISTKQIIRIATPEDIEEFEIQHNANKYNL